MMKKGANNGVGEGQFAGVSWHSRHLDDIFMAVKDVDEDFYTLATAAGRCERILNEKTAQMLFVERTTLFTKVFLWAERCGIHNIVWCGLDGG